MNAQHVEFPSSQKMASLLIVFIFGPSVARAHETSEELCLATVAGSSGIILARGSPTMVRGGSTEKEPCHFNKRVYHAW